MKWTLKNKNGLNESWECWYSAGDVGEVWFANGCWWGAVNNGASRSASSRGKAMNAVDKKAAKMFERIAAELNKRAVRP